MNTMDTMLMMNNDIKGVIFGDPSGVFESKDMVYLVDSIKNPPYGSYYTFHKDDNDIGYVIYHINEQKWVTYDNINDAIEDGIKVFGHDDISAACNSLINNIINAINTGSIVYGGKIDLNEYDIENDSYYVSIKDGSIVYIIVKMNGERNVVNFKDIHDFDCRINILSDFVDKIEDIKTFKNSTTWKERVCIENRELGDKITSLESFLNENKDNDSIDYKSLYRQLAYMEAYKEILDRRERSFI